MCEKKPASLSLFSHLLLNIKNNMIVIVKPLLSVMNMKNLK